MRRLEGRSAVITGAASGIGKASALLFAAHGANLVLVDRAPEVEQTAEAIRLTGGRALALVRDAADEAAVAEFTQLAAREHGGLDVCYANAGISGGFPVFDELTADDWMQLLRVNLIGAFLAVKHAARFMIPAGRGSIICTASVAGLRGGGGASPYSASKAGVINVVQTSAQHLAGTGVRVNVICPGLTHDTGMGRPIVEMARKYGIGEQMARTVPLRRGGRPEEIAHAALFLASDESSYVNGHTLVVDGGLSSGLPSVPLSALKIPVHRP